MTQGGYAGKILRVDLSTGSASAVPTANYAERFLGGRGMAVKIYWDEVRPETGALDPENRLIFMLGPFAGIPALGGSRWGIFGKSPVNSPETFCYGNLGGGFGAELKFAGYDGIIVQGRAERPSVISISDGETRILDADGVWGRGAIETRALLAERLGRQVKVAAIGPAGENRVTNAIILADGDASCSGGMGAVMGSKNLKAIAVRGTNRRFSVAEPDRLKELTAWIRSLNRGNTKVWGLDFMAHGPKTKMAPCYGCMAHCLRVKYTADDGTSGKFMCQSRFFYFVHALMFHKADTDIPFLANKLCDEYGIDTWELQKIMEWLMKCHRAGLISEEESGIPFSKIGSLEFIDVFLKKLALREGIGDILARGLEGAAHHLGAEFQRQITYSDPYEPRMYVTNSLIFPFEPREPIQQVHEVGLTLAQWASWAKGTAGAHLSSDVLKGIAEKFWGGPEAADFTTYTGKALAAKLIQDRQYTKESLMFCDWMYPIIDRPLGDDHVGDPTIESRIYSAVTGRDTDEGTLNRFGERAFNLQRAILLREGHRARIDDYLPDEWHDTPLAGHLVDPDCLAPGSDGKPVSRKGALIDRDGYDRMRDEYYKLRGWDAATGLQTETFLGGLDLSDVAPEMARLGLLAK